MNRYTAINNLGWLSLALFCLALAVTGMYTRSHYYTEPLVVLLEAYVWPAAILGLLPLSLLLFGWSFTHHRKRSMVGIALAGLFVLYWFGGFYVRRALGLV